MVQAQERESRHVFRTHLTTRGTIGIEGTGGAMTTLLGVDLLEHLPALALVIETGE